MSNKLSNKKPQPLTPPRIYNRCPVCGEISYSRDGVHPQCSVKRADRARIELIKRDTTIVKAKKPSRGIASWQRICPKCHALQHVRKKVCDCGHTLAALARPRTSKGESS